MRPLSLVLALSATVLAQDASKPDGLILVSHQVDLEIHENLGLLRIQFKVRNPTDRPLEGNVSFSMPRGAAVYEASILKHIGSTERKAYLLSPDQAAALYAADMARLQNGGDGPAMAGLAAGGGMRTAPQPTAATTGVAGGLRGSTAATPTPPPALPTGSAATTSRPGLTPGGGNTGRGVGANQMTSRTVLVQNGTNIQSSDPWFADPALVELVSADRYRLRFFPVPARDNQTVTIRAAFEVTREGHAFAATVPLRLDSNFATTVDTRSSGRVAIGSDDAVSPVTCSSHGLGAIQRDEDGHRFRSRIDTLGDGRDLTVSYGLGFWAKTHDFSTESGLRGSFHAEEPAAFRAVRSVRAPGQTPVAVTARGSFLVIPKDSARDLARTAGRELKPDSGPAVPATDEEVRECEFVRAVMKLPARSWAPRCEIHVVSTNEAAKLQWARDNGILSGRSNGLLQGSSFEYVKHGPGCRVQEPNVEKLRQRAGVR